MKQQIIGFAACILLTSLPLTGCQIVLPSGMPSTRMSDGATRGTINKNSIAKTANGAGRKVAVSETRTPSLQADETAIPNTPTMTNGRGEVQTVAYQIPQPPPGTNAPTNRSSGQSSLTGPVTSSEATGYSMAPASRDAQVYETGAGTFRSNAVQTLPQSATEKLIQLSGEMISMRQEMQMLQQAVQELRTEKAELLGIRQELNTRLNSMEARLEEALENEAKAQSQYDDLSQRVQIFNDRRQKQISELNQIIDQLETQLSQPTPQSAPPSPTPDITEKQTPNRTSYGGRRNGLR